MQRGLGGGSSDAACTLIGLNHLWKTGLCPDDLCSIGADLGADIPIFIQGTSCWGEGKGEILSQINLPKKLFLLAFPKVGISTKLAFEAIKINSKNITFFRGSSNDVLDRYFQCAKKFSINTIVRITADNPLIDPNIVDLVIDKYNNTKCDYGTNCLPRTFPYGTEVEIFSFKKLHEVWQNAKKPSEREHVTPYFYNNPDLFKIINLEHSKNISNLSLQDNL